MAKVQYKESIYLEYRHAINGGFTLYTRIRGYDYHVTDIKFFYVLAKLLDQLPLTSAIVIPHQIGILHNNSEEAVTLEEWLFPFGERDTNTVVYQLKFMTGSRHIETARYEGDFGAVSEDLRKRINGEFQLKVCYFCKYLVEYSDFGGTDYRHDQLYCFRDAPQVLDKLMQLYPVLRNHESLLKEGTPDMDAIHSCAAFTYREQPRP